MSGRVERVRVGLVAGCVLLLVGLAGTYGLARYKAGKAWINKIKARSGASLVRETDGFTYSQSLRGRTVFTLHAAKAYQHTDGHWVLHDVVITLYGSSEDRKDRVYGSDFEWDETHGVARAVGEVQMDLQVPSGVASTPRHGSPATAAADSIHVRTSGLVFLRNLDVAATQEPIEFRYKGLVCTAKGAEFSNNPSALHLLSDVKVEGEVRGQPVLLLAARGDLDRGSNTASFVAPVLTSAQRKARASQAVLHLRKDGSVERAEATGNVTIDAASRHIAGQRLDVAMSEKNQPQTARLSGGVTMLDSSVERPAQGEAGEMRIRFDGQGQPAEVTALNKAHLLAREKSADGMWLEREMRGETMVAELHADARKKAQLQQVHLTGAASLRGDSVTKAVAGKPAVQKASSVAADDLLLSFVPAAKSVRLDRLHGQGHAVLHQTAALGEEHTSSGETLDVAMAAPSGGKGVQSEVASAVLAGRVAISSRAAQKPGSKKVQEITTGSAERAAYDGVTEKLTMTGAVHLMDGASSLSAERVVVDQRSGDAAASGNVAATLAGQATGPQAGRTAPPQATHVAAQSAVLRKAEQVAEFTGSAARPARLWQEASQVEAGTIVMDRQKQTLVAQPAAGGVVRSVFASAGKDASGGKTAGAKASEGPNVLRVESRSLEYSDGQHDAIFTGPVLLQGSLGDVRGQRTVVYFAPRVKDAAKPVPNTEASVQMGGALDRVVVSGDVVLEQTGRRGTGDSLVYKAADGSFVLTGTAAAPPRIVDAQQGTVTGTSLLFRPGDSTIVVAGAGPSGGAKPQRARIETRVRQKPE